MLRKIKVLVTLEVEVELEDTITNGWSPYENRHFIIEENGCPGCGSVGRAIEDAIENTQEDGDPCWACAFFNGKNKIIE